MLKISPELDFTSEQFDPVQALAAKDFYLPYPKVKIYNNLADWYYHAFNKKKNDVLSNQESKTASKNNCYVLKRNYEWYYETLGLDLPPNFDIQSRYKKYSKRKRNFNGKYQIDKKVVVKEMPYEMLQPMRSSKILIKRSDGSLKDFVLVCTDPTSVESEVIENSNSKEVNSTSSTTTKKECHIFSEKIDSTSLINYCTNTLSKSIEVSKKDTEDKLENKNYILESERLLSPLKTLNKVPGVEFKNCDNCPRESPTDCYIKKSSIVNVPYNKENSKELALLELARRARNRLHK